MEAGFVDMVIFAACVLSFLSIAGIGILHLLDGKKEE
jgi:hypothetical protein